MKYIACILLAALAIPAVAQSQQEPYFASGVMASRCSKLLDGVDDNLALGHSPLAFAMLSWAEGYITAINIDLAQKRKPKFDLGSLSDLELWAAIYGYCKRNPDQIAAKAVIDAMSKLKRIEP
jgi:hypothetical protein